LNHLALVSSQIEQYFAFKVGEFDFLFSSFILKNFNEERSLKERYSGKKEAALEDILSSIPLIAQK